MAYEFQRQEIAQLQLNAYNNDKTLTLKNVAGQNFSLDQNAIVGTYIKLLTIAGAQSLYPITDSKRIVDERIIENT